MAFAMRTRPELPPAYGYSICKKSLSSRLLATTPPLTQASRTHYGPACNSVRFRIALPVPRARLEDQQGARLPHRELYPGMDTPSRTPRKHRPAWGCINFDTRCYIAFAKGPPSCTVCRDGGGVPASTSCIPCVVLYRTKHPPQPTGVVPHHEEVP